MQQFHIDPLPSNVAVVSALDLVFGIHLLALEALSAFQVDSAAAPTDCSGSESNQSGTVQILGHTLSSSISVRTT